MCASLCINIIVISSGITSCYNVKKSEKYSRLWTLRSLVNIEFLCERVAHNLNKWKSGARLLFAGISNPARARCTRTATTAAPDCAQIKVKCAHSPHGKTTKDSTHISLQKRRLLHVQCYHYSNYSILCTEHDPQLAHCAYEGKGAHGYKHKTQTHTYQRKKRRYVHACYYCYTLKCALINAQMCALV